MSDCSTVAVGALTSCVASTDATALARFLRSMPVACPVTTIASSWKKSRARDTCIAFWPAATETSLRLNPMLRIDSVTSRDGAASVKVPSSLIVVPMVVPTTET